MQFIVQQGSSKVKVMRYAGYDKEKRRSVVKQVASMDKYAPEITDEMRQIFTPEELEEVEDWIKKRLHEMNRSEQKHAFERLDYYLSRASSAVALDVVELTEERVGRIYAAIAHFEHLLKKRGFKKTGLLKKHSHATRTADQAKKSDSSKEIRQTVMPL